MSYVLFVHRKWLLSLFVVVVFFVMICSKHSKSELSNISISFTGVYGYQTIPLKNWVLVSHKSWLKPQKQQSTHEFLLEWKSLDYRTNDWYGNAFTLLTLSCFLSSSNSLFPPVSILEVECIREGCQSETLRQMVGLVPESRCFTVVFKGSRKSLDLLCQSQEEAQHWARGIRTLQERVENMTQKEKLDQYPFHVQLVLLVLKLTLPYTGRK